MSSRLKTFLLLPSLALNALFALLFLSALRSGASSVAFDDPGGRENPYATAALVVSVPSETAEILFDAVTIRLEPGGKAALQFSAVFNGRQANWLMSALYDHDIVSVAPSRHGLLLTALREGETVLQALTSEGIRDLARVRVVPR
ncbi:MAG: hypothetical protein LBP27_00735 [Treponema sp.]|nr:hypothetical protein [Treponema sp.]